MRASFAKEGSTSDSHLLAAYTSSDLVACRISPWVRSWGHRTGTRWAAPRRMVMDLNVLTVEQEKGQAANPGSDFKECANGCPVMIVIPPGKFIMGSPENEPDRNASKGPLHEVTITKPFAVSKFEVAFEEWDACVAAAAC